MSTDMDDTHIEDAHISIGARVRLVAPSPLLDLRADTGTVSAAIRRMATTS